MDNDTLSIFDIESVILTGKIIARQKDITTAQWKYLVKGQTLASDVAVAVGRLSSTDRLVIITVYRE